MPQTPELVNAVLFFAPGFLLVQILYFGGIGRGHSDFQRAIWGVIASVPIRWLATKLPLDLKIEQGSEIELFVLGLGIALVIGVIASLLKRAFVFGEEEEQEHA